MSQDVLSPCISRCYWHGCAEGCHHSLIQWAKRLWKYFDEHFKQKPVVDDDSDELLNEQAAQIPIRDNPAANEAASALVRADKLREVKAGHDGTWAAHPGLVPLVLEVFDANMPSDHQIHVKREDVQVIDIKRNTWQISLPS